MLADPRIIRGSVTAKKREDARRYQEKIQAERAEERYKTEQIRNRLSMVIGDSRSEMSTGTGKGVGGRMEMAKLAAPLGFRRPYPSSFGRRMHVGGQEDRISAEVKLRDQQFFKGATRQYQQQSDFLHKPDHPKYPITHPIDQRPFPKLPLINASQDPFRLNTKRTDQNCMKNVRFEPVRSWDSSSPTVLPRVVPTIPPSSNDGIMRRRRQIYRGVREVPSPWEHNPPTTPLGPPSLNDVYVQTEETFADNFDPLITEMVSSAIADALRSLNAEEDKRRMEHRNKELRIAIEKQQEKNLELNQNIALQIHAKKELEEQKEAAIKQINAIESRKLAVDMIEGMAESSLEELITRNKIEEEVVSRSIAIDTRHLNRQEVKRNTKIAEVKNDFFPYVYKKAERILVHKIADSYLRDALFSTNESLRQQSCNALNAQIQKYRQFSGPNLKQSKLSDGLHMFDS